MFCYRSIKNKSHQTDCESGIYLIINTFNFIQQGLGPKHFGVVLFEVDALMVERFEVILLVLLPPDLVEAALGFPPLLLLRL